MINLLISIVNYNSHEDTIKLLDFIDTELCTEGFRIWFILIDNGCKESQEGFIKNTKDRFNFTLIEKEMEFKSKSNFIINTENNGFGAANNVVIDYANRVDSFDFIWMLNSDLRLDVDCLSSLKKYMLDDRYNILGSVIVEDNYVVHGTVGISSFRGYRTPSSLELEEDINPVDAISGTSMFFRTSILETMRFDERFFMYVEENDLCYRFSQQGLKSYVVKSSLVFHQGGKTFGEKKALRWYYKVRNLLYFKRKCGSSNALLIPYLLLSTLKNHSFNKSHLKAYVVGVIDYMFMNMGKTDLDF